MIIGGHSIADSEPKYGLSVTGIIHPDRIVTNSGARPGDKLILTKKIGTGIIANAARKDDPQLSQSVLSEAIASMKTLNARASELMVTHGVTACTDVTGYGLLGHAANIAAASGVGLEIRYSAVPRFDDIEGLAIVCTKGGGERNRDWIKGNVTLHPAVNSEGFAVLADPQTSGPLLIAVPPNNAEPLVAALRGAGIAAAALVGEVTDRVSGSISVLG